jgi:hypothetical protein
MVLELNNITVDINYDDLKKNKLIYKITFPSGKIYIGKTIRSLYERTRRHCFELKENTRKINAIKKYKKFNIEVLYIGSNNNELCIKEKEYILLYDSYNKGYNSTVGGEGNHRVLQSVRKKITSNECKIKHKERTKKIPLTNEEIELRKIKKNEYYRTKRLELKIKYQKINEERKLRKINLKLKFTLG